MKTSCLSAILMSLYLSAMLTSSVTPIRSAATFAAAIDPMAAQKALQSAVSGLAAENWGGSMRIANVTAPNAAVPVSARASTPEPIIDEELLARLIKRTLASKKDTVMDHHVSGIFGINDGSADVPVKQISQPVTEGKHTITIPIMEGSKDIVVAYKHDNDFDFYLTDKSGILRAAAIWDRNGIRLITNEQAAAKYRSEMKLFARLAEELPPTGAAVAGNS